MNRLIPALVLLAVAANPAVASRSYIGVDVDPHHPPSGCAFQGGGLLSEKHGFSEVTCSGQKMIWLEYQSRVTNELRYKLKPSESLLDQMLCGYKDERHYEGHLWAVGTWVDEDGGNGKATSVRLAWRVEIDYGGFKIERVPPELIACSVEAAD